MNRLHKALVLCSALLTSGLAQAQSFYICQQGNTQTASEISFSNNGNTLNDMSTTAVDSITTHVPGLRFVGGDISMLTKYEEAKVTYRDRNGNAVQFLPFARQEGLNAMRVRLFVDPSKASAAQQREGVVQDLAYVIALSRRIKEAGLLLMLDFHYSDTWTDPGQHATPSTWNTLTTAAQLADRVYTYTKDCLQQLCAAGAAPDFIQPGNEITYGMLWPTGHVYPAGGGQDGGTWENFASYLNSGIRACREVCPRARIVIQTELSKTANVTNFYNQLPKYGVTDYDIIGLSYYPAYHGNLQTLSGCLTTLESQHKDKNIMLVETGYSYAWAINGTTYNYTATYPYTEEGQRKFTADLISTLKQHPRVNGLFWWWPEDNGNAQVTGNWWNAALYDHNTGKPFAAFYELSSFR